MLASYRSTSIAFRGSLATTRSSSDCTRGEKSVVGALGIKGWIVESASGESEEAIRAWAAALSASLGSRSTSGFAG